MTNTLTKSAEPTTKTTDKQTDDKEACCSTITEAAGSARSRREERGPQSWVALKLTILLALGIIGYTSEVYVRFCLEFIRHGRRSMGIAFLVVFCVLLGMLLWAYLKVIVTKPGTASDYMPKTSRPPPHPNAHLSQDDDDAQEEELQYGPAYTSPNHSPTLVEDVQAGVVDAITSQAPPVPTMSSERSPHRHHHSREQDPREPTNPNDRPRRTISNTAIPASPAYSRKNSVTRQKGIPQRRPPTTPVLAASFRYCTRDGHIKPFRAHHCRACGTCILKYDHHCPWIGQCVGARNHKFFFNFLQWSIIFCAWTFATVLAFNTDQNNIDPQQIVIVALAGLFLLFTGSLLISHTRLILINESTVESMSHQTIREREAYVLMKTGISWWQFDTKRRIRDRWNEEWGRVGREGNLWWLGSKRANWEDVMGDSMWGWFLPIGRPLADGMSYTPNPRFDSEGRWRRREEWPKELR